MNCNTVSKKLWHFLVLPLDVNRGATTETHPLLGGTADANGPRMHGGAANADDSDEEPHTPRINIASNLEVDQD
jgi:hypothetical protein